MRDAGLRVKHDNIRALPLIHAERVPQDEPDSEIVQFGDGPAQHLIVHVIDNTVVDDLARGEASEDTSMDVALGRPSIRCHGQLEMF